MYKTIDDIPEDLRWLAENVHEWPEGYRQIYRFNADGEWKMGRQHPTDTIYGTEYTRTQWKEARDLISGKPSWDSAPELAQWLAQDKNGRWFWFELEPEQDYVGWYVGWEDHSRTGAFSHAAKGKVLGDWRKTLEKRPETAESQSQESAIDTGACSDGVKCSPIYCADCPNRPIPTPDYNPDDVAFKPSKYHVKINGDWADVYDVLHAFKVTNPGDQHAIKKMLMPGKRGHKDAIKDREEAILSLRRAIELEQGK